MLWHLPNSRPMQPSRVNLHYLVRTLLLAVPAISIGIQVSTWISFALGQDKNRADFFAYYAAGFMLRTGKISAFYHQIHPPSFGFIHPAYEALLVVPFTFFTPSRAYIAWILVGLAIVGAILRILRFQLHHLGAISPILPVALALAFFPVTYALAQGQDSILLALLMVLAFTQIQDRREYCAGILLGLGVFRFQILLPIVILLVLWKWWKILAGAFTSSACMLGCSVAITGARGQLQYLKLLRQLADPANQYVQQMPNVRGVLAAFGVVSFPLILVISGLALMWVMLLGRKMPPSHAFLLAVAAASLLSFHGYLHDLSLLLLPFLVLSDFFIERRDYPGLAVLGLLVLMPLAAIMAGSIMVLWICALIPFSLLLLLKFRTAPRASSVALRGISTIKADCVLE
jgi:hypothetical protein